MAQYTIWCPVLVRDKFDDYCNHAPAARQRRASHAFESVHRLFADEYGVNPPILYTPAPPIPANAVEMEIRVQGVRFLIRVDFVGRHVWLEGITIDGRFHSP